MRARPIHAWFCGVFIWHRTTLLRVPRRARPFPASTEVGGLRDCRATCPSSPRNSLAHQWLLADSKVDGIHPRPICGPKPRSSWKGTLRCPYAKWCTITLSKRRPHPGRTVRAVFRPEPRLTTQEPADARGQLRHRHDGPGQKTTAAASRPKPLEHMPPVRFRSWAR